MADTAEQVKDESARAAEGAASEELSGVTTLPSEAVRDNLGDVMDRAFAGEEFCVTRYKRARIFVIGPKAMNEFRALRAARDQLLARRDDAGPRRRRSA